MSVAGVQVSAMELSVTCPVNNVPGVGGSPFCPEINIKGIGISITLHIVSNLTVKGQTETSSPGVTYDTEGSRLKESRLIRSITHCLYRKSIIPDVSHDPGALVLDNRLMTFNRDILASGMTVIVAHYHQPLFLVLGQVDDDAECVVVSRDFIYDVSVQLFAHSVDLDFVTRHHGQREHCHQECGHHRHHSSE